jgi:hypothetical protein
MLAMHRYFTDRAHEDPLDFVVRIDKATGAMHLEGAGDRPSGG